MQSSFRNELDVLAAALIPCFRPRVGREARVALELPEREGGQTQEQRAGGGRVGHLSFTAVLQLWGSLGANQHQEL